MSRTPQTRVHLYAVGVRVHGSLPYREPSIVPAVAGRKWHADSRTWSWPKKSASAVEAALKKVGLDVTRVRAEKPAIPAPGSCPPCDWAQELLEKLTPELRAAVYNALVLKLHPDAGGDEEMMVSLNVARDAIGGRR